MRSPDGILSGGRRPLWATVCAPPLPAVAVRSRGRRQRHEVLRAPSLPATDPGGAAALQPQRERRVRCERAHQKGRAKWVARKTTRGQSTHEDGETGPPRPWVSRTPDAPPRRVCWWGGKGTGLSLRGRDQKSGERRRLAVVKEATVGGSSSDWRATGRHGPVRARTQTRGKQV